MSFFPLFGGQSVNDEKSIAKCNNVEVLLTAIDKDLSSISIKDPESTINQKVLKDQDDSNSHFYELIGFRLARIKTILYDDSTSDKHTHTSDGCPKSFSTLVGMIISTYPNIIPSLLSLIPSPDMPFEAKKEISAIFNSLMIRQFLHCHVPNENSREKESKHHYSNRFAEYVFENYDNILIPIMHGHGAGTPDSALHCGSMLRSTLRHEILYKKLLSTDYIYPLLETYVHLPNFDVASDALATLRDIFLVNREIASKFLEYQYGEVFPRYNHMLKSKNYITRRMSLKLLGEILLDKTNFGVMMKYISSARNLAITMTLLSDPSSNIQFEAFHVFKIFVANPGKPEEVIKILTKNKVKLIKYLEQFHVEMEKEDDQFRDEKRLILSTLNGLEG